MCACATQRQGEIPDSLAGFLRHPTFRTAWQRLGKVVRLNRTEILYYAVNQRTVTKVAW